MSESNTSGNEWSSPPRQTEGAATGTAPVEEMLKENMEGVSEGQRDFMTKAAQSFEDAACNLTDASENGEKIQHLMSVSSFAEGGLQDMQRSLTGLVEGVMRTNLRIAQKVFLVRSPKEYIELQQQFVREYLDGLLYGFAILADVIQRAPNDIVPAAATDRSGPPIELAATWTRPGGYSRLISHAVR
jgi:hypothetical protein